jgi:3-(methylthio)propanoyl-CoA dehydrogenase
MSAYNPPVDMMQFMLHDVLGFSHPDLDRDTTAAILEEASKLAAGVLAPLNWTGDQHGATLSDGHVKTAPGFKEAYKAYCEGGWNAVPFDPEYGGQGLPWALAFPIQEMWQGANLSFGLCPLLNQGAVEALLTHGTEAQKAYYLPKLISGEWTGTMNLTEPQAGSDLGLIRTKAEKQGDGSYRISGQKIFITYGDHDMADNIIHLVLARLPDAPDDVRGISLFVVPKVLEDGAVNKVHCIGLEHKLGIHASPTCTMDFDGAKGFLIGEENQGLKYMFTMMNNARLSVGLQGVAIAERAYQKAASFAQERLQGKSLSTGQRVTIDRHSDVKRMLVSMQAQILAARGLAYSAAIAMDKAERGDVLAQGLVEILTPVVKGYATDMAVDVASLGIQVHGGMGFIEETGAAQYYRDARILPIYEGTNGIQAADLVFRKILRDGGVNVKGYIKGFSGYIEPYVLADLHVATDKMLGFGRDGFTDRAAWFATSYLKALSIVSGAAMLGRMAKAASSLSAGGLREDIAPYHAFYQAEILPHAQAYVQPIIRG